MKIRVAFKLEIILVLLIAGIVLNALSTFILSRLDQVVHSELYRYGLQLNYEWAVQYGTYSGLMMSLLVIGMLVTGISIVFILIHVRTRTINSTRFVSCLLLVVGILATGLSTFFFNRLDYVVQNDLYRFGLQFSYEWAGGYWAYAKLILGLHGLSIATSFISFALILTGKPTGEMRFFLRARARHEINSTKLISFLLFSVGLVALAFSIHYNSSILVFIGLGLVFWGAILFYIRPEEYDKETILNKTILPSLANLNKMIIELGYKGKGIYLPPKYLKDFESSRVYISEQEDMKLPSPEQIQKEEDKVLLKNPGGILLTPPGMELTRLFEEKLGTSFTKVDLQYFRRNMPRLLIEDLEIAKNVEIETQNSRVHVKIENFIYKSMCKEARKLSNICGSLGCPLCSAIACAIAKAADKPVIIENDRYYYKNDQTIDIMYRLLEEP